jgi:adenine-specific DNA-methyltransferase
VSVAAEFHEARYPAGTRSSDALVRHAYFTGGNDPYAQLRRALKADIDEEARSLYSTTSGVFPVPETGKIAIKVINHFGDEVLQVHAVSRD